LINMRTSLWARKLNWMKMSRKLQKSLNSSVELAIQPSRKKLRQRRPPQRRKKVNRKLSPSSEKTIDRKSDVERKRGDRKGEGIRSRNVNEVQTCDLLIS